MLKEIFSPRGSEYIFGRSGYVYVIKSPYGVKIGCSIEPEKRAKAIDASVPFNTSIVAIIPCEDMYLVENRLHREFKPKRIKGEWFSLNENDLAEIDNIKRDMNIPIDDAPF
jgi:hypothetical protein